MSLDHSLVGVPGEPQERSWTSADALLYAVGVGAGLGDPMRELEFTTENSEGITQQVLPTYAVLISQARLGRSLGDFDRALLVHAEQAFTLHRPLPVAGTVRTVATVTGIYDKGSGALVVTENVATDAGTGDRLVTARSGTFIRGEGGFGGDRGPREGWQRPDRAPDAQVVLPTRPEQALVYRLSGDRNPLHADPKFAARGGFSRPILHGLCSYGVTGRALLHEVCGSDPAQFAAMSGRFSRPVFPGDALTVSIWLEDTAGDAAGTRTARFQTSTDDGAVVIDRGTLQYRPAPAAGRA
jgi:acyl dehydratase